MLRISFSFLSLLIQNTQRSALEKHLFGLIDLGSKVGGACVVGVVVHHEGSMLLLDSGCVHSFVDSQNELCLSSVHLRVESSGVHAEGVDVLFVSYVSVESGACSDGYIRDQVQRPTAISQMPTIALMIKIYKHFSRKQV